VPRIHPIDKHVGAVCECGATCQQDAERNRRRARISLPTGPKESVAIGCCDPASAGVVLLRGAPPARRLPDLLVTEADGNTAALTGVFATSEGGAGVGDQSYPQREGRRAIIALVEQIVTVHLVQRHGGVRRRSALSSQTSVVAVTLAGRLCLGFLHTAGHDST
jgi:hypothetical protein